jgi:hypothetical protein
MATKRTISKGLGALTPEAWTDIVDASTFVQQFGESLRTSTGERGDYGVPLITLARITGAADLKGTGNGAYVWKYAWTRVVLTGSQSDVSAQVPTQGQLTGTTSNGNDATPSSWAINLHEINNTTSLRNGYTHTSDSISGSEGYRIVRVPNDTVVPMVALRLDTGRLQWSFWFPNPVGGTCAAGFAGFENAIDGGTYGES